MKFNILCKTEDVGDEGDDDDKAEEVGVDDKKECLLDLLTTSELDIYNTIIKDSK